MKIEDISKELQDIMKFEQESLKKIEEFEKMQKNQDLANYLRMISKNTTQREITEIQEIYLKKIDKEYLNSK
jgi:flagellar motor component MotA